MPLTQNGQAPYTTAAAAIAAIEAFRDRGMGTPVTPDTLVRSGVPESIAARTVNSLKNLDLLNEAGEPTQQFTDLRLARGAEEYQARLQEWLNATYADVLQYVNPSEHPPDRVAEGFRTYEPAGQRRNMAALLIGLWRHAGNAVAEGSPAPRPTAPRRARPTTGSTSRGPARGSGGGTGRVTGEKVEVPPGLLGLIQQIPRGGASWTEAERDRFLKAFTATLDFIVRVDDNPPTPDEDDRYMGP